MADFLAWFSAQPAAHRLLICGNHEVAITRAAANDRAMLAAKLSAQGKVTYLQDGEVEVAGLRVYCTPWMAKPTGEIYAHCAWCLDGTADELLQKYRAIPEGIDLLLTHTPPLGTLDNGGLGSAALADEVVRARPLVHCFGHVHSAYGFKCNVPEGSSPPRRPDHPTEGDSVLFVNAAIDAVAPEAPIFFDL